MLSAKNFAMVKTYVEKVSLKTQNRCFNNGNKLKEIKLLILSECQYSPVNVIKKLFPDYGS